MKCLVFIPVIGSGGSLYVPLQDEFDAANQFLAAYGSTPTKIMSNVFSTEKIKIYPNPTSGLIEIFMDIRFDDECNIMIFNNQGGKSNALDHSLPELFNH